MKLIISLTFLMFAFLSSAGLKQAKTEEAAPFTISQLHDRKRKAKKTKRRRKRKCKKFGKKIYAG